MAEPCVSAERAQKVLGKGKLERQARYRWCAFENAMFKSAPLLRGAVPVVDILSSVER